MYILHTLYKNWYMNKEYKVNKISTDYLTILLQQFHICCKLINYYQHSLHNKKLETKLIQLGIIAEAFSLFALLFLDHQNLPKKVHIVRARKMVETMKIKYWYIKKHALVNLLMFLPRIS